MASPFRPLFWICVWGRLRQTNHLIIVTSSFSKSLVFRMFTVHTKTQSFVFKFLRFQERFRKALFSVDNFSGLVRTEGLTGMRRFQIPPAYCGLSLRSTRQRLVSSITAYKCNWKDISSCCWRYLAWTLIWLKTSEAKRDYCSVGKGTFLLHQNQVFWGTSYCLYF